MEKVTSRKNQGGKFCRPEMKGRPQLQKTSSAYCNECGFKCRGKKHSEGNHHKQKHPAKRGSVPHNITVDNRV
jgi:hypothetical protein